MSEQAEELLKALKLLGTEEGRQGMQRFGIATDKALGVSMAQLKPLLKKYGKNHALALELWQAGIHEFQIAAAFVDNPKEVTSTQMDEWIARVDSWDVCDQLCNKLFDKTEFAYAKIGEWAEDSDEFTRRAAFSLLATMAVHDKKAVDSIFLQYFDLIEEYSTDERNFVKKAVNWALRQIGKRNNALRVPATELALKLSLSTSASARWIGKDAYKELTKNKK